MAVSGLSHASIQVTDMERALRFYRDVLGLSVAIDRIETSRTATADGGSIDVHRRAAYLRWSQAPGGGFVVLGQKLDAEAPADGPGGLFGRGIDHLGLWVDDIDGPLRRAAEHGAEVLHGPAVYSGDYYGETEPAEIRTVMFLDPDGTVVQVDERLGR